MAQLERATSQQGKKYISRKSVTYTDLETGGSTTINGSNITTGTIDASVVNVENINASNITAGNLQSDNYVADTTGTKISLTDGTIDTKNFKVDSTGNVNLGSGAKIIGGDGLLTNLFYEGKYNIGFAEWSSGVDYYYIIVDVNIPSNFTITEAKITFQHNPQLWTDPNSPYGDVWGYARAVKVYKMNAGTSYLIDNINIKYTIDAGNLTEIPSALGVTAYTPTNQSGATYNVVTGGDVHTYFTTGHNIIVLKSTDSLPASGSTYLATKTGYGLAQVNIIGYTSFE